MLLLMLFGSISRVHPMATGRSDPVRSAGAHSARSDDTIRWRRRWIGFVMR